jgi:murein DD-endopeptidase MepM/ murein hydrolase activator NlpD
MTIFRDITVRLEGLPYEFETVMSASISLGSNGAGTTFTCSLADPTLFIANEIMKHSMASGGLQPVDVPAPVSQSMVSALGSTADLGSIKPNAGSEFNYSQSWNAIEVAIVREALRQGVQVDDQIVYMLATASGESGDGRDMVEIWDGKGLQSTYDGRLGNTQAGDGYKYRGRGLSQVTGKERYQFFSKVLGIDVVADPDKMASPQVAVPTLVKGMIQGWFTGRKLGAHINASGTDFYNARRVINGIIPSQVNKYMNLAKQYQVRLPALKAQAGLSATPLTPTVVIDTVVKSTEPVTPVVDPLAAPATVKGNRLFVNWYELSLEFFHTGTDTSNSGQTTLTGQGLRWVLNRRNRTGNAIGLTFSQLAARVTQSQGIRVIYEAAFDPSFLVVEQVGISDYALLKREAGRAGLFISEGAGTITIKSLANIKDTSVVLRPNENLISWSISDKAMTAQDASSETTPDSNMTSETKGIIDPLTGKLVQKIADVDPTKSTSVTGSASAKSPVQGALVPGQELAATQNLQRVKRVQGLPSTFTVVQDRFIRTLQPVTALRTFGLSEWLDRVWMINKVTHNSNGTSVIECHSPVDVIDNRISGQSGVTAVTQNPLVGNLIPGKIVIPTSGTITSPFGMRTHPVTGNRRMHNGVDIGAASGTPIVAALKGVVSFAGVQSGYGNVVYIKHDGGLETRYAHLSSISVAVNQPVDAGVRVGGMGNTGVGTGVHLHFEVRRNGTALSPTEYGLPKLQVVGARVTTGTQAN